MTAWVVVLAAGLLAGMTLTLGTAAQEQLGHVSFKVSCTAEAQQKFNRAMALYHSFAWKGAQPAFAEIARLDPKCGMAWWGQALVAADNPFGWPISMKMAEGAEAMQKAKKIGAGTARERDYIAALELLFRDPDTTPHRARALAYEEAMSKLAERYPDDVEAKILYALTMSGNHELADKTFARPLNAASLLEPLFTTYPQHPGVAHYLRSQTTTLHRLRPEPTLTAGWSRPRLGLGENVAVARAGGPEAWPNRSSTWSSSSARSSASNAARRKEG